MAIIQKSLVDTRINILILQTNIRITAKKKKKVVGIATALFVGRSGVLLPINVKYFILSSP